MSRYPQRSAEEEETLRTENTKILHRLQSSLARVSGLSVSGLNVSSPLHQVLICGTVVLLQLRQSWDTFQSELAEEGPYTASIGGMRMRLPELQDDDKEARKWTAGGLGRYRAGAPLSRPSYYWPTLRRDIVCLASKAVRHKPYGDLQSLPVSPVGGRTYPWIL